MSDTARPLTVLPEPKLQAVILHSFWDLEPSSADGELTQCKDYFEYYHLQVRRLNMSVSSKDANGPVIAATTHEDVIAIVDALHHACYAQKSEVRSVLKTRFSDCADGAINDAIDLALRLWLMLNVLDDRRNIYLDQNPTIQWGEEDTLRGFIGGQFPQTNSLQTHVLDHDFIAINIVRFSGIEIKWSHSLHDHLSIEHKNGRRLLRIYPFKQWLIFHLRWIKLSAQKNSSFTPIIPREVLEETILSLDLLFPHWDPQTDNFLCRRGRDFHLLGPFHDPRPVDVQAFDHWRARILELYGLYKSPSVGWAQLWSDRRNPLQWCTFWLAVVILVFTVFFGTITVVTGIMQTCLAYEMLMLARTQVF